MPITAEQAVAQIQAKLKEKGKFSLGNLLDSVVGVATDNVADLQAMLDKLLTKKGVLTVADETALQELLRIQELQKKKRQEVRTKNALIIGLLTAGIGTGVYFLLKNKKEL